MRLSYAGEDVLISDEACSALLAYASALAVRGTSDMVAVNVVGANDEVVGASILIGPASELIALPADIPDRDMDDADSIARMRRLTTELSPSRPIPGDATSPVTAEVDDLL